MNEATNMDETERLNQPREDQDDANAPEHRWLIAEGESEQPSGGADRTPDWFSFSD